MKSFSERLGYDIQAFLLKSLDLVQNYQTELMNYYTEEGVFPREAFLLLDKLETEATQIYNKVRINREKLTNYMDFVIFDQVEDFVSGFKTIEN